MELVKSVVDSELNLIEAENKINKIISRIKVLNEAITKKKSEVQAAHSAWRATRTLNALCETSNEELAARNKEYLAAKVEAENLISELDPLTEALKVLKERYEVAVNIDNIKYRESLVQRLKDIREQEGPAILHALDLLSEICSLELALYEGKNQEEVLKKDYYKYKFSAAAHSLRFLVPHYFSLSEYRSMGTEIHPATNQRKRML